MEALHPELEAAPRVFLNADVTEEHLFVAPDDRGEIVGLVDLADAMVGAPEYDLVSMIPLLVEADLFAAFVSASGLQPTPQRLLALALLHRYQESSVLVDLATARASDLALGDVAVALLGDVR